MTVKYQWWLVQNITGRETALSVSMLEGTVSNVTDISFKYHPPQAANSDGS